MNRLIALRIIWVIPLLFITLMVAFAVYVKSEHRVDETNELRLQSYQLAWQLRQSSEDLTIMARSYIATGDAHYKYYYQSILDVRNGNKPPPGGLHNYYADRLSGDTPVSSGLSTQVVPLLVLLQQLNPTQEEFHKLDEAKATSDALADIERSAMILVENKGVDADKRRQQATALLHDLRYLKLKADILRLVDEYLKLLDLRTHNEIVQARRYADYVRVVFMLFAVVLAIMLYQVRRFIQAGLVETAQVNEKYKMVNDKLMQQALVANSTLRKLRLAADVSGVGIWIWEFGLNRLRWDDMMFDIYGVPFAERHVDLPYEYWRSRVFHEDLSKTEAALNASRENNQYLRNKFRIVLPDGRIRFIDSASVVEFDENGIPLRLVGINRDISNDIEQQEKISAALVMANAANAAKNAFLANMSHEVRTPINGVLGMLDLLMESELSPSQLDCVKTAHASGLALLEIINDIMDLTKLAVDRPELELVDFNVVDLVEDSCTALAKRAYAKGLELNCLVPPDLSPCWHGGEAHIRQVLANLIANAIKFTEHGEVFVRVMQMPGKNAQDDLRFEIHDSGIGLSEATIDRLFQPFSQADEATSRRFGGAGLGLSISKKLVELRGGSIGVNSTVGMGSCFWFTLPLTQTKSCAPQQWTADDLLGKRVLVVDDNATRSDVISGYLTHWGAVVTEMGGCGGLLAHLQEAAANTESYRLVLLNLQMPGADELALAGSLAKIPGLAGTAVVLLSSDNPSEPVCCPGTGAVQFLLKPVRQKLLYQALVTALQDGAGGNVKPPAPLVAQDHGYPGKKVLVVEDNKINQKVLVAKLNRFEILPDVVENGLAALNKLAHSRYDLIFMDCHMPVMDGYTATRELRLLEAKKGLPRQTVVAFTANALEGEFEKCLEAGMDDYITKPIDTHQLGTILAARLN